MAVVAVVVFVGAYILIVTERIHRVAAALGGAGIMLAATRWIRSVTIRM